MKKTLLSSLLLAGTLSALADNERLVLTYADGERVTIRTSYLQNISYSHEDTDKTTGYGYLSMLAHMNSGAVNRISLDGIQSVDFLADFYNPIGQLYYEVQRQHGENAEIVMLNCINNNFGEGYAITDQRDTNWTGQRYGERGFFLIDSPKGFDNSFTITGLDTGRHYNATWLLQNDTENPCGQSCWAFTMPKEPIRIVASANEETIYEGYDWLGTYSGFALYPTEHADATHGSIVSAKTVNTQLLLKGNATYLFASSAPESISAFGEYTYDFEGHAMKYVPKPDDADLTAPTGQDEYAATVQFLPIGADETESLGLVRVNNLTHDFPDNNRRYIVLKGEGKELRYVCAAKDRYGTRSTQYLVELTTAGETQWMHFTDYGAHHHTATLDFKEGSSIAGPCTAIVSYPSTEADQTSEPQFKYVVAEAGGEPQFLPLDSEPDPDQPGEAADWAGPTTYSAKTTGQLDGSKANADVTILLDQNYNGSSNPGHAVLKANVGGKELIGSGGDYKYFPAEQKIVIYHVLQGNDLGWQTDYYDVILRISPDQQSLTIEGFDGYLYGSRMNSSIQVGPACILQAQ